MGIHSSISLSKAYWASISKHKGDNCLQDRQSPWPYGVYISVEANTPLIHKQVNEKKKWLHNQTG